MMGADEFDVAMTVPSHTLSSLSCQALPKYSTRSAIVGEKKYLGGTDGDNKYNLKIIPFPVRKFEKPV